MGSEDIELESVVFSGLLEEERGEGEGVEFETREN